MQAIIICNGGHGEVEDQFHLLIKCHKLNPIRQKKKLFSHTVVL